MSKGIQQAFSELLEQYDKVRSEAGAPKAAQQYEMPPDVNFGTDQRSIAQSATSSVPNNEFKPDFSAAFGETERRKSVEQSGNYRIFFVVMTEYLLGCPIITCLLA